MIAYALGERLSNKKPPSWSASNTDDVESNEQDASTIVSPQQYMYFEKASWSNGPFLIALVVIVTCAPKVAESASRCTAGNVGA